MKKPGIPPVPKVDEDRVRFDGAVKESLETVLGRRNSTVKPLDPLTATTANIVSKINEILGIMQG